MFKASLSHPTCDTWSVKTWSAVVMLLLGIYIYLEMIGRVGESSWASTISKDFPSAQVLLS